MDGTKPSWSRMLATVIILVPLSWVTFLIAFNHSMPDLTGVIGIITGGVAATYGANKFATPGIVRAEDAK